jgi:PAS domain S-box-containing protein
MIDIDKILEYSKDMVLLYVEDNPDAREMTTMIFEEFFNNIIVAVDGEDGYQKYLENNIDIIISDITMPNLNGIEMCEMIRKKNEQIPIIFLTAHNDESYFLNSIKLGVNGFLIKPVDIQELVKLVARISQRYVYEKEAKIQQNLLEVYQKATNYSSIVSKADSKGYITYVNNIFCELSGYTREELIGKNHNIIRHQDNPKSMFEDMWHTIRDKKEIWKGIVRNRTKDGKSYYADSVIMPILDLNGEIIEYISLRNDVTDIMNPAKQLSEAVKNTKTPYLIYIKLDKFDMIEDFYDNETINRIESMVSLYLQAQFSKNYTFDKIYELGNGEYAIIVESSKFMNDMKSFVIELKELQESIKEDIIDLGSIEYDVSILISFVSNGNKVLESAKLGIKKLLQAKHTFLVSNNLAIQEQERAKENMKVVSMIKTAILHSKIVSYFQPIIDNKTQKIVKYESLVRLIDENEKVLAPYYFLETSKKSNYYSQITNIVFEHSFTILKNCTADISINLSAIDIEQKSTREAIIKHLEINKKDASRVVFELLEDEGIKDFQVVKDFIKLVKGYGVKIAIDDFGAGYSNYERLLDYQPDILKIDGCLIRDIETSSYSLSAVKSIVTFAKEQNMQTIAEYIENESIFNIVKNLGVDFSQGYYFGKPEPLNKNQNIT